MQQPLESNEHGFALVLELVVLALVVSAMGFGFYQYHQNTSGVASTKSAPVVNVATDLNKELDKEITAETAQSTSVDTLSSELQSADAASADIDGGIDESSF